MPVLVIGTEKNFAALRPRLFGGRRVSSEVAKRVAAALRQANPEVDFDALRPGTVVSVPELDDISVAAEQSLGDAEGEAFASVLDALVRALATVADDAGRLEDEATAGRRQLGKLLRSSGVRKATERDPNLAVLLDGTLASLAEEEAAAKDRAATVTHAVEEWAADLDGLRALLS